MNAKSCPNCQQLAAAEAAFCGHCRQQFAQAAPAPQPPPPGAPLTPPPPQAPVAQPHPHAAPNQQPAAGQPFAPTDSPEPQEEPSYLFMGGLFVVGLLITVIPPIFFNTVIYIIQFAIAVGLFQQTRKARDKNKMIIGYILTGLMIVLGIIAIFIAVSYGE